MPQAWTLIRSHPACGSGISRSTISNGPFGLVTCTARIFFAIIFLSFSSFEKQHECLLGASTSPLARRSLGEGGERDANIDLRIP